MIRRVLLVGLAAAGLRVTAPAQSPRVLPVLRLDGFIAEIDAAHAATGLSIDLGSYVRADAVLGGGVAWIGDRSVASGRAEVVGRFLLDPFRQARWGPYVGVGLIARADEGERARGLLTLVVGTELPGRRRWVPAIEAGYGGGVRVGGVLRRSRPARR